MKILIITFLFLLSLRADMYECDKSFILVIDDIRINVMNDDGEFVYIKKNKNDNKYCNHFNDINQNLKGCIVQHDTVFEFTNNENDWVEECVLKKTGIVDSEENEEEDIE